jgi:hypothetical protein
MPIRIHEANEENIYYEKRRICPSWPPRAVFLDLRPLTLFNKKNLKSANKMAHSIFKKYGFKLFWMKLKEV